MRDRQRLIPLLTNVLQKLPQILRSYRIGGSKRIWSLVAAEDHVAMQTHPSRGGRPFIANERCELPRLVVCIGRVDRSLPSRVHFVLRVHSRQQLAVGFFARTD